MRAIATAAIGLASKALRRAFVITAPDAAPLTETAYSASLGPAGGACTRQVAAEISGAETAGQPGTGYVNAVGLTQDYTFLRSETGHNEQTGGNDGRTAVYAKRVKLVQDGQGDLVAYNASVRIRSYKPGATHWLAGPAGVIINGTVIGEVDGCYLNPLEFYLTDKPDTVAYNVTCVGFVANMLRNAPSGPGPNHGGTGQGQVWAGSRYQSRGTQACDVMVSGIGKWHSGIDLSMPALDFGANKCAVAMKAGDRWYFNASAAEQDDSSTFIRVNWRATAGFSDYAYYDTATSRFKIVIGGNETLQVSSSRVTVPALTSGEIAMTAGASLFMDGKQILKGRAAGWALPTGTLARSTFSATSATVSATYSQAEVQALADRVQSLEQHLAALLTDLHIQGGAHGLLGT